MMAYRPNRLRWSIFGIVLFVPFLGMVPAHADFFLHRWDNHHESKGFWSFELNVMYYSSTSNFDGQGNPFTLQELQNYTRIQDDLILAYGISKRLSLYGRLSWAYINQNSAIRPGSSFGFADQTVGINFRALESRPSRPSQAALPFSLDLQLQLDFPAYSTALSEKNLTPYLGDGTIDVTGGLFATIPVSKRKTDQFNFILGAGYTYRTAQFSAAIPWSTYFQYTQDYEGLFATIGAAGVTSLRTDPYGTSIPRSSVGSGGSFITGATNPSLLQAYAQLGYKIGPKTEFSFAASQSIWGQAAPNGLLLILGFQTRLGYDSRVNPILLSPKEYGHSNSGFQNYSLEGRVLKSNDRLNLVKIDKGSQDGIEVGQIFDLFVSKKDGSAGEAIARARVTSTKTSEAALEVVEFYKEVWIEEGFFAKRLIQ